MLLCYLRRTFVHCHVRLNFEANWGKLALFQAGIRGVFTDKVNRCKSNRTSPADCI